METKIQEFLAEIEEDHPIKTAANLLCLIGESIHHLNAAVDEISTRYPHECICREVLVDARRLSNGLMMAWFDKCKEVTVIEDAAEEIADSECLADVLERDRGDYVFNLATDISRIAVGGGINGR